MSGIDTDETTMLIPISPTRSEAKNKENPVDHCMIFRGFTGHRRYERNADICGFMRRALHL